LLALSYSSPTENFIKCSTEVLGWAKRRERLLGDILLYSPDVVCLQEVDHFHDYFSPKLKAHGYTGIFLAKPDSPCLRVPGHTSPDGCAVFVNDTRLEVAQSHEVILKDDQGLLSNQVAIIVCLNDLQSNRKFLAAVTHLKAKEGNERIRLAQGKDLLLNLRQIKCDMGSATKVLSTLVCGDFNATPDEAIYQEMLDNGLNSSYQSAAKQEAYFTTWKFRPKGEVCHTIDYVWHSSGFNPRNFLEIPSKDVIGEAALPSVDFPSDHLSLVFDFELSQE
jgi:nocturnin